MSLQKKIRWKIWTIAVLSLLFSTVVGVEAFSDPIDPHQALLLSTKDEVISLLRWGLITIVPFLVSVIGLLYRDLAQARAFITQEIKEANPIKMRLVMALENLPFSKEDRIKLEEACKNSIKTET